MNESDFHTGPRGIRLRLCEWGTPSNDRLPLLVLHGFLEQGAAWDAVASGLDCHVIAPDQRGFGLSEHVGAGGFYHFYDYLGDVDALVAHLGGRVDLLGHSMGGTVAAMYAGTHPANVRRLILVEGLGPPDTTAQTVPRVMQFTKGLRELPSHRPFDSVAAGTERIRRWNPGISVDVATRLVARTTRPHPDGGLVWTWDPLHRVRSPKPFAEDQFARFLAAIEAPTLSVMGGATNFLFAGLEERAKLVRGVEQVTIPAAGHLVHHDAPTRLTASIEAFLSR